MTTIEKHEIKRALNNIEAYSDTDVFPRSIDYEKALARKERRESIVTEIERILNNQDDFNDAINTSPPVNQSTLYPAGYSGHRWVTRIDPMWNIAYLSIAIHIAREAEKYRIPHSRDTVFSHRFNDSKDSKDLFCDGGWRDFIDISRRKAEISKYVLSIDLADFYSRIYLHRIENEVQALFPGSQISKQLNKLLMDFNTGRSFGIPIGGPASRILSELVLNAADQFIANHLDLNFTRYADDYRIFVDTIDDANHTIAKLSEYFYQNEGMSIQKHKTRTTPSNEFIESTTLKGAATGSAEHLLGLKLYFDPYSETADEDYETLRKSLEDFDLLELLAAELVKGKADLQVITKITRSLRAMPPIVQEQACTTMLEHTAKLYPVLPKILKSINLVAKRAASEKNHELTQNIINSVTASLQNDRYISDSDINTIYCARIVGEVKTTDNEKLLGKLYQRPFGISNQPSTLVQVEVLHILARWSSTSWLRTVKNSYGSMHPRLQEEFYRASYVLRDEGAHWRERTVKQISKARLPLIQGE